MTISRFDILAAQLQVRLLKDLGDPVPGDVIKLASLPLPEVPKGEISQFEIDSARVQRRIIRSLNLSVPEEIDRVANMKDIE